MYFRFVCTIRCYHSDGEWKPNFKNGLNTPLKMRQEIVNTICHYTISTKTCNTCNSRVLAPMATVSSDVVYFESLIVLSIRYKDKEESAVR